MERDRGGGLIADKGGALYGTTGAGGDPACDFGCGTVFRLAPSGSGYVETLLYRFQGGTDGFFPVAGLVADESGALYGTTAFNSPYYRGGTVFKLTPSGSGYAKTTLYSFRGGAIDGDMPFARLLLDPSGALYGTTLAGGPQQNGTVFKLTPTPSGYQESIIHFFQGYDGELPEAGLIADAHGSLYGTTTAGGTARCRKDVYCRVVFKLMPSSSGYAITDPSQLPGRCARRSKLQGAFDLRTSRRALRHDDRRRKSARRCAFRTQTRRIGL
jgi:uncharacterized repeat protein (TIGR03803 family)